MTDHTTTVRWTDNHCHLGWGHDHDEERNDGDQAQSGSADVADGALAEGFAAVVAETLTAAQAEGVQRFINVGTDLTTSQRAIAVAETHPEVWATVGVHPHDAEGGLHGIEALLDHERVVAVGECGLDYYYDNSPRQAQRDAFAHQIGLAHQHQLPLVIHTRDAWDETFAMLDTEGIPTHTVFHCFTGGPDEAELALERGAVLSFSGIVTFKSANDLREAAKLCPLDRLMVETDSPYLAPVPNRGKTNQPGWVPLVGAAVAETKGVEVAEVAAASWATAEHFYGLGD